MESRDLVGCSEAHRTVLEALGKLATSDAEILLTGPSGVGKELYANFVHAHSHRKNGPFVPVNCGALSDNLLENELFGHVSGAFTGAKIQREGLVDEAQRGTLFFDEVDSLDKACQIKLLRFLQDKQFRRLGENRLRRANVRVIAATNADLQSEVEDRRFREDLFFRLRVAPVDIPPLRERPEDVPVLLKFFIDRCADRYDLSPITFSLAAQRRLLEYQWPGNVRELENCVAYLTCLQLARPVEECDLPLLETGGRMEDAFEPGPGSNGTKLKDAKRELVASFERHYLERALEMTNGNVSAAARISGKNRRALFELIRKYGIDPAKFRVAPP